MRLAFSHPKSFLEYLKTKLLWNDFGCGLKYTFSSFKTSAALKTMKLSTIFAFAVIYCGSVEAANLRRFLEDFDSGSSDFLGDSSDSSATERSLQEFDTSIDGSSVLDSNGEPSNSGFMDVSEEGSTFRRLEEEGFSINGLESSSDSEGDVDSEYQPGTVKPASFDASGTFDESGVLWWK